MKKNAVLVVCVSVVFAVFTGGCGNHTDTADTEENLQSEQTGTEAVMEPDTENNSSQLQLGTAVEIPAGFQGQRSETDANEQLEKIIAEYYHVAEENYANVRYNYNYTDLNGDGENEILAFVSGEQAEGIDGNVLLWLDEADTDRLSANSVRQVFHQAEAPVYISSHMTQGYRDLIISDNRNTVSIEEVRSCAVPVSLEQTYLLLTWNGEQYQAPEEGTALFSLDGYEGTAVLTDIKSDSMNADYHFLGEAMKEK